VHQAFNTLNPDMTWAFDYLIPVFWPLAAPFIESRSDALEQIEAYIDMARPRFDQPMWEWEDVDLSWVAEDMFVGPPHSSRYNPLANHGLLFESKLSARAHFWLVRDAALVAIALELHKRRFGDSPARLEDIPVDILSEIPPDQFTGDPIRYLVVEGQPTLYTVAVDRDDDGGRLAMRNGKPDRRRALRWKPMSEVRAGRVPDGDWILYPFPEDRE